MKLPPGSRAAAAVLRRRPVSAASLAGVDASRPQWLGAAIAIGIVLLLLVLSFPRNGSWLLGGSHQAFDRPAAVSPLAVNDSHNRATAASSSGAGHAVKPSTPRGSVLPAIAQAAPTAVARAVAPPVKHSPAPPAAIKLVDGSAQLALVNLDRATSGLKPLTWSTCLGEVALASARRMAAAGAVSHGSGVQVDLTCGLGSKSGENVGDWSGGIDDSRLNAMFMSSPTHRANILDSSFHYVGIAWAVAPDGTAYIAEEFG